MVKKRQRSPVALPRPEETPFIWRETCFVKLDKKDRGELKVDKSLIGVMVHLGLTALFLISELFVCVVSVFEFRSDSVSQSTPRAFIRRWGFTIVELLVVVAIVSTLASLLLPTLSSAKTVARKIKCISQLKQLTLADYLYRADSEGVFPVRANSLSKTAGRLQSGWPNALQVYFKDIDLLLCPQDRANRRKGKQFNQADTMSRSYLFNGWNDHFLHQLKRDYSLQALTGKRMNECHIQNPSETILFGEKRSNSQALYMDFLEGFGNDISEVEHSMHTGVGKSRQIGSSSYGFADGSVRSVDFGGSFKPVNLWATQNIWRTNTMIFSIE